jgi:hypothetical protein
VNAQRTLDAERPYLRLAPVDEMASLIAAIDRTIEPPAPDTPLLRGTIGESPDWTTAGDVLIRYATEGGMAAIVNAPAALLTPAVRAKLYELLVAIDAADAMRSVTPA